MKIALDTFIYNNMNKIWTTDKASGSEYESYILFLRESEQHHNTELKTETNLRQREQQDAYENRVWIRVFQKV